MSKENAGNRIDGFAVAFTRNVIRFRWLVIMLSIAIAGAVATGIPKLAYDNNYRAFFSPENPELQDFENLQKTFTKNDNFVITVVPTRTDDIFNSRTLTLVERLTEEAWQTPYSNRVDSITNFQYTYADGDELIVEDLVSDPATAMPEELQARKKAALAEPLLNGQIITPDLRATTVNVVMQFPEESLTEVPEAVASIRALRDRVKADYPDHEIYISGTTMLSNAFSEAIAKDFSTLIPAMIGIIILTTIFSVRSVSATLSTILLIILSSLVGMGWAGHAGIALAGPSPSAVIVILTLAIADSIHILISIRGAMRDGLSKREAIIEGMRINFLAVSITSITTMVGFMSLNFSDSPPFRDLGNISAVGIMAAWFYSLTLLPALISLVPFRAAPAKAGAARPRFLTGLADFVIGHHRLLFVTLGVASVALIAFIPRNTLSDEFRKYFSDAIEFRRDSDKMVEYFGFYPLEFTVRAGSPGGVSDPAFLTKLDDFAGWLRTQENVEHVFSLSDIMKRLNKNLNQDDPAFYRIPEDRDLSAQYLLLFELSLPYGLDLNDRIDIDKSSTRVTVTFDGDTSSKRIRAFLAEADRWFEQNAPAYEASLTGAPVMFTFIAKRNLESMIQGTTIAIVSIAVIMVLALRSVSLGLISIVPNALPILSAFGAWAFLVGEVGFSVAAVASISLGIVIDDTVHFLTKYVRARREKQLTTADSIRYAFETVGVAIMVNTIIISAGFLVLTLSAFKINYELGLLTALSIGFALILDFLFLPALLMMFRGREGEGKAKSPAGGQTGDTQGLGAIPS